jgi:hypothetical protein
MIEITWQFQASIPGGPAFSITQPNIAVGAYDVASAKIGAGAPVDVAVQPSSTPDDVLFVVVSSDIYGDGLTYKIDGGATVHKLDAPHIMLGAGAVGFMNDGKPPQKLTFTSSLTTDAHIQVVAGRKNP